MLLNAEGILQNSTKQYEIYFNGLESYSQENFKLVLLSGTVIGCLLPILRCAQKL